MPTLGVSDRLESTFVISTKGLINEGNLRSLNDLAKRADAQHIVHTGDFGFYDESSLERIAEKSV